MARCHDKGFTLTELLVVVAIIAVLVAIAIPVFISQLESARTATCNANTRSMKAAISTAYMSNGNNQKKAVDSGAQNMGDANTVFGESDTFTISAGSLCPENGTYAITFSSGNIEVTCSIHDGMSNKTVPNIYKVLEELGYLGKNIDSMAPSGNNNNTDTFLAALKNVGLDLNALGVESWHYQPSKYNEYKYALTLSAESIADKTTDDKVGLVIRARIDDDGKILYSIWQDSSVGSASTNGATYNALTMTGTEVEYNGEDKTNFAQIKALYNQLASARGLSLLK